MPSSLGAQRRRSRDDPPQRRPQPRPSLLSLALEGEDVDELERQCLGSLAAIPVDVFTRTILNRMCTREAALVVRQTCRAAVKHCAKHCAASMLDEALAATVDFTAVDRAPAPDDDARPVLSVRDARYLVAMANPYQLLACVAWVLRHLRRGSDGDHRAPTSGAPTSCAPTSGAFILCVSETDGLVKLLEHLERATGIPRVAVIDVSDSDLRTAVSLEAAARLRGCFSSYSPAAGDVQQRGQYGAGVGTKVALLHWAGLGTEADACCSWLRAADALAIVSDGGLVVRGVLATDSSCRGAAVQPGDGEHATVLDRVVDLHVRSRGGGARWTTNVWIHDIHTSAGLSISAAPCDGDLMRPSGGSRIRVSAAVKHFASVRSLVTMLGIVVASKSPNSAAATLSLYCALSMVDDAPRPYAGHQRTRHEDRYRASVSPVVQLTRLLVATEYRHFRYCLEQLSTLVAPLRVEVDADLANAAAASGRMGEVRAVIAKAFPHAVTAL